MFVFRASILQVDGPQIEKNTSCGNIYSKHFSYIYISIWSAIMKYKKIVG